MIYVKIDKILSRLDPTSRVIKFSDYLVDNYISNDTAFPPLLWADQNANLNRTTNAYSTETLDDFDELIDIAALPMHFDDGFVIEIVDPAHDGTSTNNSEIFLLQRYIVFSHMWLGIQHTNKLYVYRNYIMLHSKDVMHAAFLCIAILASAPAAIANDRSSSIAGPIFRTQPAPRPAPSRSNGHTTVTETVLVPQPALCHSDDQTTATKTADSDAIKNPPRQHLYSTQSLELANSPGTRPSSLNETAADTDSYAHYCDQDDEYVEDDYIQFFCCIPIIFLIMLVLLGHLNLHYFCTSRMKKDSLESVSSRTTNS
ncbi:uncharacterized protein LOC132938017 [Metopolophium dirhodum]|uniref:uncharacterized protein LOC132938017 n=1 Tax=Metopolophium dirhodum TaxID=44670 RepID=UPI00298FFD5A|nr:uncharacterized protein LOC132938017 [Metopolophium dirhodum]